MSTDTPGHPLTDTWVAAIYRSEDDPHPVASAVVTGPQRVLTCARVIEASDNLRTPLWVAFPKKATPDHRRYRVKFRKAAYDPPVADLAVLFLEEAIPDGVAMAPLRSPRPSDLTGCRWWAFGFDDPLGDSAEGIVQTSLGSGWISLRAAAGNPMQAGFIGTGLWSPEYAAVVAVVAQVDRFGGGRAITLNQADLWLPSYKRLTSSSNLIGEAAGPPWGWSLAHDREGVRHWRPVARGVSRDSEPGNRFRGRTEALKKIVQWLERATLDRRVLVVTGSPGAGKSAVVARIVTTADAEAGTRRNADDKAVRARPGSVGCAVHAKGKSALEVAEEIAKAASARLPVDVDDLAPAMRDVLEERGGQRFNLIIDALDEAASPAQARQILDSIVLPLVETCGDVGAQVIIGTRRCDEDGDLLSRLGAAMSVIDLDAPEYFSEGDLASYALSCLQQAGAERTGNPYADDVVAGPLASQIAAMSVQNFLIAGLTARTHGLHDQEPADPELLGFNPTVDIALRRYLALLNPVAGVSAADALTALAFAEAPGLSAELWRLAVESLYRVSVSSEELTRFARSAAANFLIEIDGRTGTRTTTGPDSGPVFRLFHLALEEALLRGRSDISNPVADQRALAQTFITAGRTRNWQDVPAYLLRSLAGHAAAGGLIDDLLADDTYLLHADLRRLLQVADQARSSQGIRGARLLRLTPRSIMAGPSDRAALFSVTAALENLGVSDPLGSPEVPYQARWASARLRRERTVLDGHRGEVFGVCPVTVDGRELLASASDDATVRIWDPQTGEQRTVLHGHQGAILGICPVAGGELLASAGRDGTVRIWHAETGEQRAVLRGHQDRVYGVCTVIADGELLASAGRDGTVRIWDPWTGEQRAVLEGHRDWVYGVCPVLVEDRELVASAGRDGTVRIWDPRTGEQRAVLEGHRDWVFGVCPVRVGDRELLASAGDDGTVRIWDPKTGEQRAELEGHRERVYGVCPVLVEDRQLLASAGRDGTVRVWDPRTGEQRAVLEGHQERVYGVCPVLVEDRELLASAGRDGTVRIWEPGADERTVLKDRRGAVVGSCPVTVKGQELLVSADVDATVRIWDPRTGEQRAVLEGHHDWVLGVCPVTADGRELLASAGMDGTVRIWDLQTGEQRAVLEGHHDWVFGVCPVTVEGRELLASAGGDRTVRIWDPKTGEQRAELKGHKGCVYGVCPVTVDARQLLASAGGDRTVRIWDPKTGEQQAVLKGHQDRVFGVCPVTVEGRELLASAGGDGTVRIWDPETAEQWTVLGGHQDGSQGVCPVTVEGRQLLASAGGDRTVRVWDPRTGACLLTVPTHYTAWSVASVAGSLAIGLDAGILVVTPTSSWD